MKTKSWISIGLLGLTVTLFFVGANWYQTGEERRLDSSGATRSEILVRPYSPAIGSPKARVTLVEFLDPECDSCGKSYPSVKRLLTEFDGKLRLVVRHMPFHDNSVYAAAVLEAARKQNKFWEALAELFLRQPDWARHEDPRPDLILGYMGGLGLDIKKLTDSIEDPAHLGKIQQDYDDGVALDVFQTPTFFVNGTLVNGIEYGQLKAAVTEALRQRSEE